MAFGINIEENNIDEIIKGKDIAIAKAMEIIGQNAEKYAKALCPVGTSESTHKKGYRGGTLRNSITHEVEKSGNEVSVSVGSNVEYAPYVELGTGPNFKAPPEWEEFNVPSSSGIGHSYVKPRPFIKPAIEEHMSEYESIIKNELGE